MAFIPAVVTDDARMYWSQYLAGLYAGALETLLPLIAFRVGEGGWEDPGTGPVPRIPDPTLRRLDNLIQDIDARVDPTRPLISQRYPINSRANFEKALLPADITWESPSVARVECLLDFGDFNDDGFGNPPEIWEIGIFTRHPGTPPPAVWPLPTELMLAYGTFPMQLKDASRQLLNVVRIVF
jgi:hypothetical protein